MDTAEEIANIKTDSENHTELRPEFTNQDAENLYASCLDIQRLEWGLQQEVQLAKLITKLKRWVTPITESKQKFVKSLGFVQQGNTYVPLSKFTQEQKEVNAIDLNEQMDKLNKEPFEYFDELKKIIPLPLFNEKKLEDVKFTGCSQKQYFIEWCITSSK